MGETDARVETLADGYVEARQRGIAPRDAAREAGYSDATKIADIERIGGPVDRRMADALAEKGWNERWLLNQFEDFIKQSKSGKEFESMALVRGLEVISRFMGHGRKGVPNVAVQINNGSSASPQVDDLERARELVGEVSELLKVLKAEIGERKPSGLHGTGPEPADQVLPARQGVGEALGNGGEPAGGGGA